MNTIWKFPLVVTDEQTIFIPAGHQFLTVQIQRGTPCLWASLEDEFRPRKSVKILTVGTGNPCDLTGYTYVGTYQPHNGGLVFHVFAKE